MKKNLIALMIAAGTVMSASAVAQDFEAGFGSGSIGFGGSITTPMAGVYEGKVSSLNGLDATIRVGAQEATIAVPANTGLLALRSINGFNANASNKLAKIEFDGQSLSDLAGSGNFRNGKIDLALPAKNTVDSSVIGTVTVPVQVAAISVIVDDNTQQASGQSMSAVSDRYAFFGGLPYQPSAAIQVYDEASAVINNLFPNITGNFPAVDTKVDRAEPKTFTASGKTFYTAYAAGVLQNDNVRLQLSQAADTAGVVSWVASVPVTVSYN
ncbi:hypothetical protein G5G79_004516 [Escherichia coli]|nr:hypothetical protein [Escherichia coli]